MSEDDEIDPKLTEILNGMVWEGLEGDMPLLMFDKGEIGIVYNTLEEAEQSRDELRKAWGKQIQAYAQERVEAERAELGDAKVDAYKLGHRHGGASERVRIWDALEMLKVKSNGGIQNDMITEEINAMLDKAIQIARGTE